MSLLHLLVRTKLLVNLKITSRTFYTVQRKSIKKDENYLAKHIFQKIKAKGPITVAEYMKEVLTNPMGGYYMNKDVFGEKGDFITSPEITQMFGEMIAVWFLNEWQRIGSPKPLQIVELGPGRGTLSSDILKVFGHFNALHNVTLNLIEISPYLSEMQAAKLCTRSKNLHDSNSVLYKEGVSHEGIPVRWFKQLSDMPNAFTLFIAHEFFDALPIHKFHKTYTDYKEVLIDIDQEGSEAENPRFRYVLARHDTPMCKVLLNKKETREHVEISPEAILLYKQICKRITEHGGIALICDYGHNGSGSDTFRAFKKHKQVDPLIQPGTADLTADVDFNIIRQVANDVGGVISFGPVTQKDFLLKIGLEYRFDCLKKKTEDNYEVENLKSCYDFLTNKDKMGERFKFFTMFPSNLKSFLDKYPIVGFS